MRIVIATIKDWNIKNALLLKGENRYEVFIITSKSEMNYEYIKQINPDYIFFPHWSSYIKEEIYSNFKCVVFHLTDLPFGRGGSPLQNLIVQGIYDTKISAISVCNEVDAGKVYLKKDFNISQGSAKEIFSRASNIIFSEMIPEIIERDLEPKEQIGDIVVFSRRTPEQSEVDVNFNERQLYDHIRMLDGEGYPAAFIRYGKYRLEFRESVIMNGIVECNTRWVKEDD